MTTLTQSRNEPAVKVKQKQPAPASAVQSSPNFRKGDAMNYNSNSLSR